MNTFFWEFVIQLGIATWCFCMIIPYPMMWPFFTTVGLGWVWTSFKKFRKGIRCVRQSNARKLKKEQENGIQ